MFREGDPKTHPAPHQPANGVGTSSNLPETQGGISPFPTCVTANKHRVWPESISAWLVGPHRAPVSLCSSSSPTVYLHFPTAGSCSSGATVAKCFHTLLHPQPNTKPQSKSLLQAMKINRSCSQGTEKKTFPQSLQLSIRLNDFFCLGTALSDPAEQSLLILGVANPCVYSGFCLSAEFEEVALRDQYFFLGVSSELPQFVIASV